MPACGYEFYLLVFNSVSHSFAVLTRDISSWTLEDKIHIHVWACNVLYSWVWYLIIVTSLYLGYGFSLGGSLFIKEIDKSGMVARQGELKSGDIILRVCWTCSVFFLLHR